MYERRIEIPPCLRWLLGAPLDGERFLTHFLQRDQRLPKAVETHLDHRHSAVYMKGLAGNIGGFVAGQK